MSFPSNGEAMGEGANREFKILETLGQGGFGTVYRAEMVGTGGFRKLVALKVLNADDSLPEECAIRLRDEARMLGLIRHRAVVGVDSLAFLGQQWAVVMEYVPGVNLSAFLQEPPPLRISLEIMEEVASALWAAYAQENAMTGEPLHLVHRDLKPGNIRITSQGEVKVLDFGAASAEFRTRESDSKAFLFGLPDFMAPERFKGADYHQSDVYSMGIIFALLLTAAPFSVPPREERYQKLFVEEMLQKVQSTLSTPPSEASFGVMQAIVKLLGRMMAFDFKERPTGREVQLECRGLVEVVAGPRLKSWCESEIPRLMSQPNRDTVKTVLLERSETGCEVQGNERRTTPLVPEAENKPQPRPARLSQPAPEKHSSWKGTLTLCAVILLVFFGVLCAGQLDLQQYGG